jgi:hypothetical protein
MNPKRQDRSHPSHRQDLPEHKQRKWLDVGVINLVITPIYKTRSAPVGEVNLFHSLQRSFALNCHLFARNSWELMRMDADPPATAIECETWLSVRHARKPSFHFSGWNIVSNVGYRRS